MGGFTVAYSPSPSASEDKSDDGFDSDDDDGLPSHDDIDKMQGYPRVGPGRFSTQPGLDPPASGGGAE